MNLRNPQSKFFRQAFHAVIAALLASSFPVVLAQEAPPAQTQETTTEEAPKLPADQLDSLVAPIALYSDSLLAQTLAASTYPLEIIQLQQWGEEQEFARPSTGGRRVKAAMGSKHPGTGGVS